MTLHRIITPLMLPGIRSRLQDHDSNRPARAFVLFNLHDGSRKPSNLVIRCSTASESRRTNPFQIERLKSPDRPGLLVVASGAE